MKRKCNYIGYSLILIALLSSSVLFFFYPGNSELGQNFNVVVISIFIRYFALVGGVGVILLRLLRVIKKSDNLVYIFFGTLNLCLGVFSWILYFNNAMVIAFLHMFILNVFVGVIILIDVFLLKTVSNRSS